MRKNKKATAPEKKKKARARAGQDKLFNGPRLRNATSTGLRSLFAVATSAESCKTPVQQICGLLAKTRFDCPPASADRVLFLN
jgi:hypothetical protein